MGRSILLAFLMLGHLATRAGDLWVDLDTVSKSYMSLKNIKCDVSVSYFYDIEEKKPSYSLEGQLIYAAGNFYSKIQVVEMIVNSNEGLMLNHDRKLAIYTKNANKLKEEQYSIQDASKALVILKNQVDSVYLDLDSDGRRLYRIMFKQGSPYLEVEVKLDLAHGYLLGVVYYYKNQESGGTSRVVVEYETSDSLSQAELAKASLKSYISRTGAPKLIGACRDYELAIQQKN